MFRRFLQILSGSAGSVPASLSGEQIIAAVNALSQQNSNALQMAHSIIEDKFPSDLDSFDEENVDEMTSFNTIAASLECCGKLEVLDWAASKDECVQAFAKLFEGMGIDVTEPLKQFEELAEPRRGDAVGLIYAAFRSVADAANKRIIGLSDNSDTHHFTLVAIEVAEIWTNVRIGDNQYIEDVDWQFKKLLRAQGIVARSTNHPSKNERLPPA